MATNRSKRHTPQPTSSVLGWLLESDPSIRWQAMRDLTDAPDEEIVAERAKVATSRSISSALAILTGMTSTLSEGAIALMTPN